MPESLLIERGGSVVLVTLNRPEKLNAMSNGLISGLILDRIELDRSVRAPDELSHTLWRAQTLIKRMSERSHRFDASRR